MIVKGTIKKSWVPALDEEWSEVFSIELVFFCSFNHLCLASQCFADFLPDLPTFDHIPPRLHNF